MAYLLIYGELPSSKELARWDEALMRHSAVPDAVERAVAALPHDAHFMGIVLTAINALSTVHPEQNPALAGQNIYKSKEIQDKQIVRLIGEAAFVILVVFCNASNVVADLYYSCAIKSSAWIYVWEMHSSRHCSYLSFCRARYMWPVSLTTRRQTYLLQECAGGRIQSFCETKVAICCCCTVQVRCRLLQRWRTTGPVDATSASPTSACPTLRTSCTCSTPPISQGMLFLIPRVLM